ncbi:M18 family aminopeptidase [bacterium]|nr:M18 family aminopeptidase [bacterium]
MEKLKQYRTKLNLTQKEVAEKLDISQQAYALYENSDRTPSDEMLEKLAAIFNITKSELESKATEMEYRHIESIEDFLLTSYTSYHSTRNIESILKEDGFERLYDYNEWNLKKGGKYYILKNQSAVIAFKIGNLSNYAFNIAGCHTDSPCLKVKGNTLIDSSEGKKINVEVYGGLILYSMLDIPLKIAGRIIVNEDNKLVTKIVSSDFNVNIPSLCIHHNSTVNDSLTLNKQVDMLPLLGSNTDVYSLLSNGKEVIDADLYVVPDVKPYLSGVNKDLLVSPRLDNLTSAYAIAKAIIESNPKGIAIGYFSDNEEIGSGTKQGASSMFLPDTLEKINRSLGFSKDDYNKAIANGFALSIDNGHAVHQAHPEKSDISEKVYMNKGIVIKHHTNYSTDGLSSSIIKTIAKTNKISYQDYYNRSDQRCGGTIGLITSSQLEMNACDIGLAQLAMHSAIETIGYNDIKLMMELVKSYFNTSISTLDNYEIKLD